MTVKTITIDYDLYHKELEEERDSGFKEGFEEGERNMKDHISVLLTNPADYYGENWRQDMAGELTPEIEKALLTLHKNKERKHVKNSETVG